MNIDKILDRKRSLFNSFLNNPRFLLSCRNQDNSDVNYFNSINIIDKIIKFILIIIIPLVLGFYDYIVNFDFNKLLNNWYKEPQFYLLLYTLILIISKLSYYIFEIYKWKRKDSKILNYNRLIINSFWDKLLYWFGIKNIVILHIEKELN